MDRVYIPVTVIRGYDRRISRCSNVYEKSKNSLDEIWNSRLTGKLRNDLAGGIRSGVCRHGCCTFEGQLNEV